MKDIKRRLENFSFYDHTGIARHLEKMAARGWMFEGRTNVTWRYRRITPCRLHFAVAYFPSASDFDPEPLEQQKVFWDFCEAAGWEHILSFGQMQIFVNRKEDPVPLETDALVQVNSIHKAMKKSFLRYQLLILLVALLNGSLLLYTLFDNPIYVLGSNTNLFTGLCWIFMLLICGADMLNYFRWYRRAVRAAQQEGVFMETAGCSRLQYAALAFVLAAALFWLSSLGTVSRRLNAVAALAYIVIMIVLVNAIKNGLKRRNVKAGINRTVTVVSCIVLSVVMMAGLTFFVLRFAGSGRPGREPAGSYEFNGRTWYIYADQLPLTIEDMMETDSGGYSREWTEQSSVCLTQYKAMQRGKLGADNLTGLEYSITRVKVPFIYDMCLNSVMEKRTDRREPEEYRNRYVEQEAGPWEAEAVYRLYSGSNAMNQYLVCWKDKFVEITFFWEPTDGQIAVAAEKLKDV